MNPSETPDRRNQLFREVRIGLIAEVGANLDGGPIAISRRLFDAEFSHEVAA
jgi:hypothetical protein